ncbi:HD domain-containing phosphohydrolase [Chloroflexota bacterium]
MVIPQKNVLIVDDEETLRYVLNMKLTKEGYYCEEAGNADQALAKLKGSPSELVVLDINMPGKPGNEFLPELRLNFPETAVIMATGVTDTSVIAQCIKDGAQDYIRKPFTLNKILLSVSRALEKRRIELQIREYQQHLTRKVKEKESATRKLFLCTIETIICALEDNDKYTMGHSREVTGIALAIGQRLGLSSLELDDLRWGALLHDVGKIAVDPNILNKPGELTPEEYRHIMTHAFVGPSLVKPFVNGRVVGIISHHHDHYNGRGLGQIVAGRNIPLGARIVAAADAFEAMTSDRPYWAAMSRNEAVEEMLRCSGTQFDPIVVNSLLEIAVDEVIPARMNPVLQIQD